MSVARVGEPCVKLRRYGLGDQADEEGYCTEYGLNDEQRAAGLARNVLQLIAAGGNVYYLAKFAGIFGLDVQDLGAQQTGMSKDQFKAKLLAAGRN